MNEINVTTYNERPIDFKALQWDDVEAHEIMLKWLEDMRMQDVKFVKRQLYSNNESYIEFRHPRKKFQMNNNEPVKLFVGQYVVFNMQDRSFDILSEHSLKEKYALKLPEFETEEAEEEISDEPHPNRGFIFLDEALRKVMGIKEPLFPEIYRNTPLRPLPLNALRLVCGLPPIPPEDLKYKHDPISDALYARSVAQFEAEVKGFDFNEVGVDLSVEFTEAKTEPVELPSKERYSALTKTINTGGYEDGVWYPRYFQLNQSEGYYVGCPDGMLEVIPRGSIPPGNIIYRLTASQVENWKAEERMPKNDPEQFKTEINAEPPNGKPEPTILSGLCLIKGKLYGIRESDGSLDEINFNNSVFSGEPQITNITVHTANDKKRSMQPWPTQVTDSKGVIYEVAGDGMLELPVEPEPLGEDYVIEYTKYNDSTVDKGAALLQQAFPMMKTEVIFHAMTHLAANGILFREQL